jgi:hypothetical protein
MRNIGRGQKWGVGAGNALVCDALRLAANDWDPGSAIPGLCLRRAVNGLRDRLPRGQAPRLAVI